MLTTALTLAFTGLLVAMLADLVRRDGRKIMAALRGQSWALHPSRPVTIRFSPRAAAPQAVRMLPRLRAAA